MSKTFDVCIYGGGVVGRVLALQLAQTRLRALPSQGSYFQLVDYSRVSDLTETEFCQWLTREIGVAAIPLSVFYDAGYEQKLARLCFAKQDATLLTALERLRKL